MNKLLTNFLALCIVALSMLSADPSYAEHKFTVHNPTIPHSVTGNGAKRLDLCARWGIECGQPAAQQFCRSFHGADATNFTVARDVGQRTPTRTIKDGLTCAYGFCDAISSVTCQKKRQVDNFLEACSSTAIIAATNVNSVREVQFGQKLPRRSDGIIEVRNGGVILSRNDSNKYEIDLEPNRRSVNFFCLNGGTWHKEVLRCNRTSDILHINRSNGGGRKFRARCYQ